MSVAAFMRLSAYAPLMITSSGHFAAVVRHTLIFHQMRAHGLRNLSCAMEAKPGRQRGLTAPPAQTGLSISRCIEERLTCSKYPTTGARDDRMISGMSCRRSVLDRQHEPCQSRNNHDAPREGKGTVINGEIVVDMTRRTVQALVMSRV